jgi:hypothetical protein
MTDEMGLADVRSRIRSIAIILRGYADAVERAANGDADAAQEVCDIMQNGNINVWVSREERDELERLVS